MRYLYEDILIFAKFPDKRIKKILKRNNDNIEDTTLSEEENLHKICFEILDNMISELSDMMKGFSKVLNLFPFLYPEELKTLSLEELKRKSETHCLQYNYISVTELSIEII